MDDTRSGCPPNRSTPVERYRLLEREIERLLNLVGGLERSGSSATVHDLNKNKYKITNYVSTIEAFIDMGLTTEEQLGKMVDGLATALHEVDEWLIKLATNYHQ